MRFKNRYYLVEIIYGSIGDKNNNLHSSTSSSTTTASIQRVSDVSLQSHQLQSALREAMLQYFGEWGIARVQQSLQVRYLNSLTNIAIIRVARSDSRTLAAIITFLTQLKTKQLILRTIHLAGTIRNCQKHAILFQRKKLTELQSQLQTLPDQAQLHGILKSASTKPPQQVLTQLASLLSQYQATKSQLASATTSYTAASSAASSKPMKAELTVAPNPTSIQSALDEIEEKGTAEIMAIDS